MHPADKLAAMYHVHELSYSLCYCNHVYELYLQMYHVLMHLTGGVAIGLYGPDKDYYLKVTLLLKGLVQTICGEVSVIMTFGGEVRLSSRC